MPYYHILLDVSCSFAPLKEKPCHAWLQAQIAHWIEENDTLQTNHRVGISFFADHIVKQLLFLPLASLPELIASFDEPRIGSSVIDALAKTLSYVDEGMDPMLEKKLIVVSDFEENASQYYDLNRLADMLHDFRRNRHWEYYAVGMQKSYADMLAKIGFDNLIF